MIIAVASGKGGTGKTMISTAMALSYPGSTYVDLDVEEPNGEIFIKPEIKKKISFKVPIPFINEKKCTFCGACAKACQYHSLVIIPTTRTSMFFPELCHSCGVCSYVCPVTGALKEKRREMGTVRIGKCDSCRFIEGRLNIGQPSAVPLISGIVDSYVDKSNESLFLFDAPPGTSCPVVETLKESDYVILVAEPTPFGLNDLELMVELVQSMGKQAGIIINKEDDTGTSIDDLSKRIGIPVLLRIPYSLEIQRAYSTGIPLNRVTPGISEQLRQILVNITEKDPSEEKRNG